MCCSLWVELSLGLGLGLDSGFKSLIQVQRWLWVWVCLHLDNNGKSAFKSSDCESEFILGRRFFESSRIESNRSFSTPFESILFLISRLWLPSSNNTLGDFVQFWGQILQKSVLKPPTATATATSRVESAQIGSQPLKSLECSNVRMDSRC